jgi:hypothetical protein
VLLECEAYTNLKNELKSDITTLFCEQNVDAGFTGLPPHGKMMFVIGGKLSNKTLLRIII